MKVCTEEKIVTRTTYIFAQEELRDALCLYLREHGYPQFASGIDPEGCEIAVDFPEGPAISVTVRNETNKGTISITDFNVPNEHTLRNLQERARRDQKEGFIR